MLHRLLAPLLLAAALLAQDRPNVVLIVADDQAWSDFGFMGHDRVATPHLDRLAAEGATFRRGYVTAPLCRPSLASLVTGLHPHQHGVTGNDAAPGRDPAPLDARLREVATLPRLLADAGYRCLQTGKWWEGSYRDGGFTDGMTHGDPQRGGRHGDAGLRIGRETMAPIADFLDDVGDSGEPFFVWYAPFLPHTPHDPPPRLLEPYLDTARHPAEARYLACCTWLDETVGTLRGQLDERGMADDTVILFCVDNGWITLPDGRGDFARSKRSPYEAGVRTPLIVHAPGRIEPGVHDGLVSTLDVVPTVLALCGVEPPAPLPGIDLLPITSGRELRRGPVCGASYTHDVVDPERPARGLRFRFVVAGDDKLIAPARPGAAPELYDVVADPHETENLAAGRPQRVAELRRILDERLPVPPEDRLNLLLIVTDDQRHDAVGFAGHPQLRTPNLDTLAARGVRFTNAFVTTSICAASRASILTGLWEGSHGYTFGTAPLAADHATYPELLQRAGYRTGFVGKLGVNLAARPERLFDWIRRKDGERYPPPDAGPDTVHLTDEIASDAISFLERSAVEGRPFCLSVSFRAPHADDGDPRQYVAPAELSAEYADAAVQRSELESTAAFEALPPLLQQSLGRERFGWRFDEPEKRARMIREYLAMIAGVDRAVGRMLERLAALELADETLVVFTSDNGYFLGERGLAGKWLAYEESIRVPLVVADPRQPQAAASARREVVLNTDLAPTLLAAAGVPAPGAMQGRSLLPLLGDEPVAWRSDFFYEHRFAHRRIPLCEAVRTRRYTYARYRPHGSEGPWPVEQLFDRERDPRQLQNLIDAEDYAPVVERLRARAASLRALYVR